MLVSLEQGRELLEEVRVDLVDLRVRGLGHRWAHAYWPAHEYHHRVGVRYEGAPEAVERQDRDARPPAQPLAEPAQRAPHDPKDLGVPEAVAGHDVRARLDRAPHETLAVREDVLDVGPCQEHLRDAARHEQGQVVRVGALQALTQPLFGGRAAAHSGEELAQHGEREEDARAASVWLEAALDQVGEEEEGAGGLEAVREHGAQVAAVRRELALLHHLEVEVAAGSPGRGAEEPGAREPPKSLLRQRGERERREGAGQQDPEVPPPTPQGQRDDGQGQGPHGVQQDGADQLRRSEGPAERLQGHLPELVQAEVAPRKPQDVWSASAHLLKPDVVDEEVDDQS
mmetsp:Transcript_20820/g.58675  ORF Transcript_20820/g.58675 Transcript_20820/m.58675 type:complete len:342 (-) Transcript_20820:837-1862(-)